MAKLRWYKASGATPPALPKLRWYKASASGSGPVAPKLRWYKATGAGTAAPVLLPLSDFTLEPLNSQDITVATAPGSSTPDSYTWRIVSGGPATLTATGATATLVAPARMPPNTATVVVGVRAFTAGAPSPEVTATVTVPPCLRWDWDRQTSAWVGVRAVALTSL
jgi:hypothetical protein